ncbi:hypothetical protein ACJ72_08192, partial [Emergomyces africanus]
GPSSVGNRDMNPSKPTVAMRVHPRIPAVGRRKLTVSKPQTNASVQSKHPSTNDQPSFKQDNKQVDKMHQSGKHSR